MKYILCTLISYLFGSISPAYFIGKKYGVNVKEVGTKNAGTSNVFAYVGKKQGVLVFIIDVVKTIVAIELCKLLFPYKITYAISASFVILGHIFPFYMHFNGGKGFACLIAAVCAYSPLVLLIFLVIAIPLTLITDYLIVGTFFFTVAFPITYLVIEKDIVGTILIAIPCIIMMIKHIPNIKKIKAGTELKLRASIAKKKQ